MTTLTSRSIDFGTLFSLTVLSLILVLSMGSAPSQIVIDEGGTASQKIEDAKKAIQAENWDEAYRLALAARNLEPKTIEPLRLLLRSSVARKSPQALDVATSLFLHPESRLDEKVQILGFVQLAGDKNRFTHLYDQLGAEDRKNPDVLYLKANHLISIGADQPARIVLEEYLKMGGDQPKFQILLAGILIKSDKAEDRTRGQQIIADVMGKGGQDSHNAFLLLGAAPVGSILPELFPEDLSGFVPGPPESHPEEDLVAARIKLARFGDESAEREGLFAKVLATHAGESLELLCSWLTGMERPDLILKLVDEEKGQESPAFYDIRLGALIAARGPEAGESWLDNPHPDSEEMDVWRARALIASLKKDKEGALAAWEKAFALAKEGQENPNGLVRLYRTAVEIGELEAAALAALQATESPSVAFPSFPELQPVIAYLSKSDRLEESLMITRMALTREPGNLILQNNLIYTATVLNVTDPVMVESARDLVQAQPRVLAFRNTLAFALLRVGEHAEALEVLEQAQVEWDKVPPTALAVFAIALEKNDKKDRAAEIWKLVDRAKLGASEQKAFDEIRG